MLTQSIKQGYPTCKHVHEQPTRYRILCVLFDIHLTVVNRCTRQLRIKHGLQSMNIKHRVLKHSSLTNYIHIAQSSV